MAIRGSGVRKLSVTNLHKAYTLNEAAAKKIISNILKFCACRRPIDIQMVFLDDRAIKALNNRYKGLNRATDVLAFNIDGSEFGQRAILGEAYISVDAARRNGRLFFMPFEEEVVLYMVHAILHIFGYDDETDQGAGKMLKKQDEILGYLWKREDLSKVLTPR